MDNHLGAAWAWSKELDLSKKYNLLHIDKHPDLIDNPTTIEQIKNESIFIHSLTIKEYCDLEKYGLKVFDWASYIMNFDLMYPGVIHEKWFAIKEPIYCNEEFITKQINQEELIENVKKIDCKQEKKWIVNIDVDYFFDKGKQAVKTDFIKFLIQTIKEKMECIAVLTIAMSPECCWGWKNSVRITSLIAELLEITEFGVVVDE